MDVIERLGADDVAAPTLSATEHLQRYRWAAKLCGGRRVLDLCCGVGYGSAILAEHAEDVLGIDRDEEAITEAQERFGSLARFEQADAHRVLGGHLEREIDTIVCFEGIEHLDRLDDAVKHLLLFAEAGGRLILSVPNSETFGEDNPFHMTDFDWDSGMALFARFPDRIVILQYVAEGTLLVRDGEDPPAVARLEFLERIEPGYANNLLLTSRIPREDVEAATVLERASVAPYFNRELQALTRANRELWTANRQLGRSLDETRRQLEEGGIPLAALRTGVTSGATTLAGLITERENAERRLSRMAAELGALQADRGLAWHRYHQLRNRRVVRLGLVLTKHLRTRR